MNKMLFFCGFLVQKYLEQNINLISMIFEVSQL